ncbi:10712_t:CDS:2 [Entrophospora sp. SA101]|nr:10712_t:CDS:2 [Entrophospora sp. SA101]
MDDLNNDDFYNDDYYSALSLLRPSIQLDSDSTTTSETIMAVPKSSPVLTKNSQSTKMWRAKDRYNLVGEHNEFAKCKFVPIIEKKNV